MRCKTATHQQTATRSEKTVDLQQFVDRFAGATESGDGEGNGDASVCLIARSLDSPVAKALAECGRKGLLNGRVRAIFGHIDQGSLAAVDLGWDVHIAQEPRLLDAHEQLTIGCGCWYGDCLRRDPHKRDVLEQFQTPCEDTARQARVTFGRLWNATTPVRHGNLPEVVSEADVVAGSEVAAVSHPTRTSPRS